MSLVEEEPPITGPAAQDNDPPSRLGSGSPRLPQFRLRLRKQTLEQAGDVDARRPIPAAGLDQEHASLRVFVEAGGQGRPCAAAAHDHIFEPLNLKSRVKACMDPDPLEDGGRICPIFG
jgi:hypothetical protein